ncbi:MAG: endolytic transglycosylase MltG [Thermoanaerobaculia bacterium]
MSRLRRALLAAGLLLLGAATVLALWAWRGVARPFGPGAPLFVEVEAGATAAEILADLERRGVIADARLARAYLVYALDDPPLKAGEYRFDGARPMPAVLDMLIRGEVVVHPVTIPEGLTLDETARLLAEAGFGESAALSRAMLDPRAIADLDPAATDLEGYLFPDTYHFARATTPAAIVEALVATFRERWERDVRPLAPGDGASPREIVTLASIVEKEARLPGERPLIAGVYASRLRRGIALYADPTIIYALKRAGTWAGDLTREHLAMESPYNTYRVGGLPPSPICSPGAASLQAAAAPAEVPYLDFDSRNDGSHVFAVTLAEHNRNVATWQRRNRR